MAVLEVYLLDGDLEKAFLYCRTNNYLIEESSNYFNYSFYYKGSKQLSAITTILSFKSLHLLSSIECSEYFVPKVGGHSEVCLLVSIVMLQMVDPEAFQPRPLHLRTKVAIVVNAIIGSQGPYKA